MASVDNSYIDGVNKSLLDDVYAYYKDVTLDGKDIKFGVNFMYAISNTLAKQGDIQQIGGVVVNIYVARGKEYQYLYVFIKFMGPA